MKQLLLSLAIVALFAGVAQAKSPQLVLESGSPDNNSTSVEFPALMAKSTVDTTYLLGGPGRWDGSFETPGGEPDWHGWTHEDVSVSLENHWHVSTYMADQIPGHGPGNHAMYCGDESLPACDPPDTSGGYGSDWLEDIEWIQSVADPSQPVTLRLTGAMTYHTEIGYDYIYLILQRGTDEEVLATWDGLGSEALNFTAFLSPGDFSGSGGDEVRLVWRFRSDFGWDDLDCQFPSRGACQIDDLTVYLDGLVASFDDFEPGNPVNWTPSDLPGVGDFASLRNNLEDVDPCRTNYSYQANFVDDGLVVPGTGGTPCIDWCYGPGGYILNHDGGQMADYNMDFYLHNLVVSPPLSWPGNIDGAQLTFDIFMHEPINATSSGMFGVWQVRSTASAAPADLQNAPWKSRDTFIENSRGAYFRKVEPVGDLLVPDRQWVQVALGVHEAGFLFGLNGPNGTPSPYFDNVALKVWDPVGPEIEVTRDRLWGDAYPEAGILNETDLAANWCRVDMAGVLYNGSRGDSLVAKITPLRHGATVVEPPALHWVMKCNPVFDTVRPSAPDGQGILRGMVAGSGVSTNSGTPLEDQWSFDLPDTGFFFPGDMLQYFIHAADDLDGDIRPAVWPADTTGVLDFSASSSHPYQAKINALPTVTQPVPGVFHHPWILFVDDSSGNPDSRSRWLESLDEVGLQPGTDLDVLTIFFADDLSFYINTGLLAEYHTLVYSAGDSDASMDDFAPLVIDDWLSLGQKKGLFAGQTLASHLNFTVEGFNLLSRLGVYPNNGHIAQLNGGFWNLLVSPAAGNDVLPEEIQWQINAACPETRFINAITPAGDGQSAAALGNVGDPGGPYSAVMTVEDPVLFNRTAFLPFNLDGISGMTISSGKNDRSYLPASTLVYYLMSWLGSDVTGTGDDLPGAGRVSVNAHPNPFNPQTTIAFELPRAMEVSLDIYDLQGRLVRRLLDENPFVAGGHQQVWDGRDGDGRATSSGVYFFRFVAGDQKRVGKLTLLK